MTMLKVSEIERNSLDSFIDCLNDYDRGYICDIISEIADSNTSVYYSDIIEFISNNVEEVNGTIEECGWDGCGSDLYKAGQIAECRKNENEMYNELEEGLFNVALSHIQYTMEIEEISDKQLDEIETLCSDTDNNDRLEDFLEKVEEIVNDEEEEEEKEE